jgi:hypothetical protein
MSEYIWCDKRNQKVYIGVCQTMKCGKRKKCDAWKQFVELQNSNKKENN